jgi:Cu/Ag efflux pump CusA
MWIVKLALRRPLTFVIASILILVLGVVSITCMATDIFPEINIPVVSVIWSYGGVSPEEMELVNRCKQLYPRVKNQKISLWDEIIRLSNN